MSLNVKGIMQRAEAARTQRAQESKLPVWKPEADPTNKERWIPNRIFLGDDGTAEGSSYMVELAFHHKIFDDDGTEHHPLCGRVAFGKKCAACVYAKQLRAHGNEEDAREVEARDAWLCQVLTMPMVKGKDGVMSPSVGDFDPTWKLFYATGKQIDSFNTLMMEVAEEFECDFTDPDKGLLLEFKAKGMKLARRYDMYRVLRKSGHGIAEIFGLDPKIAAELWKSRIDLSKVHTKIEDQAKLASILGIEWDEDEESVPSRRSVEKVSSAKPVPTKARLPVVAEPESEPEPVEVKRPVAKAARPMVRDGNGASEEEEEAPPRKAKPIVQEEDDNDDVLDPDEVIRQAKERAASRKVPATVRKAKSVVEVEEDE